MSEPVAEWFAPDGVIARRLPDFEHRAEQVDFAVAVERALRSERHLCAEVGTGVGKSFAYLLPAVLHATSHLSDGPVVVSTRTIALQGQLEHKDLPFLQSVHAVGMDGGHGESVATTIVCLRRMHLAHREADVLFADTERARRARERIVELVPAKPRWKARASGLEEPVSDTVWDEVKAEHGNCLHRACPHYERMPLPAFAAPALLDTRAHPGREPRALHGGRCAAHRRRRAICPQHRVVIFDEAHHLRAGRDGEPRIEADAPLDGALELAAATPAASSGRQRLLLEQLRIGARSMAARSARSSSCLSDDLLRRTSRNVSTVVRQARPWRSKASGCATR